MDVKCVLIGGLDCESTSPVFRLLHRESVYHNTDGAVGWFIIRAKSCGRRNFCSFWESAPQYFHASHPDCPDWPKLVFYNGKQPATPHLLRTVSAFQQRIGPWGLVQGHRLYIVADALMN